MWANLFTLSLPQFPHLLNEENTTLKGGCEDSTSWYPRCKGLHTFPVGAGTQAVEGDEGRATVRSNVPNRG